MTEADDKPIFTTSSEGVMYFHPPKHECPKHGITEDGCITFWRGSKNEGDYCMECYKDLIRAHCQPVKRV